VGQELVARLGTPKRAVGKTYLAFRAFARQSKNYFESARATHHSSASLLYYYSFLNLIKAGLVIRNPSLVGRKLNHGLSYKVTSNRIFPKETVQTHSGSEQVFAVWYEECFGERLLAKNINVSNILGYASDIGAQYQMCNLGAGKLLPGLFITLVNEPDKLGWGLVGIRSFHRLETYKKRLRPFLDAYEAVDVPKAFSKDVFGINAYVHNEITFFESRNPHPWLASDVPPSPWDLSRELVTALGGLIQTNYYPGDSDFHITLPYLPNRQFYFDETTAIYAAMFYLSSLVRYKPEYLESLLDSRDAWLIENFVKFSPGTFLRGAISWVIYHDYLYSRR
jgi:hypothetical protein